MVVGGFVAEGFFWICFEEGLNWNKGFRDGNYERDCGGRNVLDDM